MPDELDVEESPELPDEADTPPPTPPDPEPPPPLLPTAPPAKTGPLTDARNMNNIVVAENCLDMEFTLTLVFNSYFDDCCIILFAFASMGTHWLFRQMRRPIL